MCGVLVNHVKGERDKVIIILTPYRSCNRILHSDVKNKITERHRNSYRYQILTKELIDQEPIVKLQEPLQVGCADPGEVLLGGLDQDPKRLPGPPGQGRGQV